MRNPRTRGGEASPLTRQTKMPCMSGGWGMSKSDQNQIPHGIQDDGGPYFWILTSKYSKTWSTATTEAGVDLSFSAYTECGDGEEECSSVLVIMPPS